MQFLIPSVYAFSTRHYVYTNAYCLPSLDNLLALLTQRTPRERLESGRYSSRFLFGRQAVFLVPRATLANLLSYSCLDRVLDEIVRWCSIDAIRNKVLSAPYIPLISRPR